MKWIEVAHLYIGCKIMRPDGKTILPLMGMLGKDIAIFREIGDVDEKYGSIEKCKPILYPLSAMTPEQRNIRNMLYKLIGTEAFKDFYSETPESFKWYLDNHFDIYNLIPKGEAIDVTTLETNPYFK